MEVARPPSYIEAVPDSRKRKKRVLGDGLSSM